MSLIKPYRPDAVDKTGRTDRLSDVLLFLLAGGRALVAPNFNHARQNRNDNDPDDQQFQVLLHHRQIAEQVASIVKSSTQTSAPITL